MKTHRRYWVFFLLFLFSGIAYLDRVNMSVAGKPIAHEFGLSPSRARLSVLLVPVGLCADDAARRPVDRPLGHACRGADRRRGVVGGADGDRNGRQFRDDAGRTPRHRYRRGAVRPDLLWQRPGVVALYRARHRHRRDLGRVQPRAGARRAGRGLVDRDAVMALVLHHHRRGRLCLGRGLARTGLDTGKDAVAAASRARTHPRRTRRRHRAAEPRWCRLSRADPLPGDVGPVHLSGLPRLHGLSVHLLAAELPANRSASVDAQLRHLHGDPVSHRHGGRDRGQLGSATGC